MADLQPEQAVFSTVEVLVDTELVVAAEVILEDLAAEEIGKTKFIYLFIYLNKVDSLTSIHKLVRTSSKFIAKGFNNFQSENWFNSRI